MDTLLYFQSTATTSARRKLDGVCKVAHEHGWLVQRFDLHNSDQIRDEISFWHPVGCIVEISTDDIALPKRSRAFPPTVLLDCNPGMSRKRVSTVSQRPGAVGAFAAEYLLGLDLAAYAYIGWPERKFWDRMRRNAFCRAIRNADRQVFYIDTTSVDNTIDNIRQRIADGLASLPLPTGVYCVNDSIAAQALEAARGLGLSVPHDVALLGTDNETHLCENTSPTLSSVELDFECAGIRSVEIIAKTLADSSPPIHELFGPLRIVQRSSTRRSAKKDGKVVAALDLIRERATMGLRVSEVAKLFNCSRRAAEMRFKATTGHSFLDEIHAIQIERAKQLLAGRRTKISIIPSLCGHRTNPFFMKLFRHATGLTMREWQQSHAS